MKYKCLDCGCVFDEPKKWVEGHGEKMRGCPSCSGDYEEAVQCEFCKEYYLSEELFGGLCKDCIEEYRYNFEICKKISIGCTDVVEINSLLASLFDANDIEAILMEHLKTRHEKIDCGKFINNDIYWFAESLIEEVNNNENAKG